MSEKSYDKQSFDYQDQDLWEQFSHKYQLQTSCQFFCHFDQAFAQIFVVYTIIPSRFGKICLIMKQNKTKFTALNLGKIMHTLLEDENN